MLEEINSFSSAFTFAPKIKIALRFIDRRLRLAINSSYPPTFAFPGLENRGKGRAHLFPPFSGLKKGQKIRSSSFSVLIWPIILHRSIDYTLDLRSFTRLQQCPAIFLPRYFRISRSGRRGDKKSSGPNRESGLAHDFEANHFEHERGLFALPRCSE